MYMRRDLRLEDNTALNFALAHAKDVALVFVLDPRQVTEANTYRSEKALMFMKDALSSLMTEVGTRGGSLTILSGLPEEEVPRFATQIGATMVCYNRDYTPFAKTRDTLLEEACVRAGLTTHSFDDTLLVDIEKAVNKEGRMYKVFTPFYKTLSKEPVPLPRTQDGVFARIPASVAPLYETLPERMDATILVGTREAAEKRLQTLSSYGTYATTRDVPGVDGTTHLSAYLKFGVVSPREVYHRAKEALGKQHEPLTRQLYWRDFFTLLAHHTPRVFGSSFVSTFDQLSWQSPDERFEAWKEGRTGFPIVDAGMRQLKETGWMHNRVRMITASFLTKDLHIDWREGERYFATMLIDYDPAVNNGSWQWVAGTGADAQPWFRIFNPWLQQKKFDPQATYIYRYITELRDVPVRDIHAWDRTHASYSSISYPPPILDHPSEARRTLETFRQVTS